MLIVFTNKLLETVTLDKILWWHFMKTLTTLALTEANKLGVLAYLRMFRWATDLLDRPTAANFSFTSTSWRSLCKFSIFSTWEIPLLYFSMASPSINSSPSPATICIAAAACLANDSRSSVCSPDCCVKGTTTNYIFISKTYLKHLPAKHLPVQSNGNTRKRCEICSKLTIKAPERHQ